MENSTRTRESFRNAGKFLGARVNVFDAATSSFNKNESITDAIKMLFGYSGSPASSSVPSSKVHVRGWTRNFPTTRTLPANRSLLSSTRATASTNTPRRNSSTSFHS
jgi:hypothetical protein